MINGAPQMGHLRAVNVESRSFIFSPLGFDLPLPPITLKPIYCPMANILPILTYEIMDKPMGKFMEYFGPEVLVNHYRIGFGPKFSDYHSWFIFSNGVKPNRFFQIRKSCESLNEYYRG